MNHSPDHAAPKRSYVLLFLPLLLLTFHSSAMGQDLRGRFIWSVANSKVDIKPGIVYFRKTFEVQEVKSALLEITCDDGFRVFLNGKLIGSDTVWQDVIRYDVSPLIQNGVNAIAVHAENASKSPAGLYCKLTIQTGKETITLPSDKSWKFSTAAKTGWRKPDFDDSSWSNALEQGVFGRAQPWGNQFAFKSAGALTTARKKAKLPRRGTELVNGDRVVFLGGTFVERLQSNDYLESLLTSQFPDLDLKFRNLGWSGDNVFGLSRAVFGSAEVGFQRLENDLLLADPTLVIACYGLNESFRGKDYIPTFRQGLADLAAVIDSNQSDLIFLSPMLMEKLAAPLPDPRRQNENIRLYAKVIKDFAAQEGYGYVDNLRPLGDAAHSRTDVPAIRDRLTENGMHLTNYGHWRMSPALTRKLGGQPEGCVFEFDLSDGTYTTTGSTIHEVKFDQGVVGFSATDDKLVYSPPPKHTPRGGRMMAIHDRIRIVGLAPGKYGLQINGKPTLLADAKQWAAGVLINRGDYLEQPEQLRKTILQKNEMFFHRHRPQNETYLYLFRKHEQGNNAVEIPRFDPIISELENKIAELKKPRLVRYQVSKIDGSK